MTSVPTPTQAPPGPPHRPRWGRRRDLILYPTVLLAVAALGLVWNGALSLVLTPVWMLLGVWLIPAGVARVATALKSRR